MIFYKLIGYNPLTDTYTNPISGEIENLPMSAYKISDSTPDDYELFDNPENWAKYGSSMNVAGLKDYLSLRYQIYTRIEIIAGADYNNWNDLSNEQKKVALIWCSVRIVNTKGPTFYATECGGSDIANMNISNYLDNSFKARKQRYSAYIIYGYSYLGKIQGLKAENYARQDFLDLTYTDRGVVFLADDGIEGLGDWILGQNSYLSTGLKPRIISGEFTLAGGLNVDTFCDTLIGILNDGLY